VKDESKKNYKLYLHVYFILISTFVIVGLISIFYLIFIKNNLALLNVINASLITMLVLINGAYGYFTWRGVNETRNDRKVAFIERRLVKLYYPLKDIICKDCWNTNEIDVKLYLYLASNKLDESLNVYFKEQNKGVHQSLSDSEMSNLRESIEIIVIEDIERLKKELAELVN